MEEALRESPTSTMSTFEEADSEDLGEDEPTTKAEVTEVVKKLLGGKDE